ncbi:hypothetical protein [Streptococcus ferus]|uniref:Membrane protein n=1 Tax=Streptococcus ferus TaxID=1345 RepID=A0A2X3VDB8_9STRE|nr:hypothetical protein [Streptococcus ferus]SQF39434.1 membrane protein [Streptococcus ferus]
MNKTEFVQGYEQEIAYQKHMIENLGRWFTLMFVIASLGLILIYSFKDSSLILLIIGILLSLLGILAMLVFGYGIYKGRLNVQRLINRFEQKLKTSTK